MTRDDLAKMYEKANGWSPATFENTMDDLERFAALVAAPLEERIQSLYEQLNEAEKQLDAQYQMGVEAEREACAKVCDEQGKGRKALEHYAALTYSGAAHDCAAAIRARGQA